MIIIKLKLLAVILILISVQVVSAYTLDSSGANPNKTFKCQESSITANFSNYTNISDVNVTFTNQRIMLHGVVYHNSTTKSMTDLGSGIWSTTFSGDPNMLWGSRTISFSINESNVISSASTGASVLVYSDTCTGVVSNYTQVGNGLGRYTSMLYSGQFDFFGTSIETGIIGWALYPWIEVWGYLFYVIVVFSVCSSIYLKTQNVVQPLIVGLFLLLVFASTYVVDYSYRQWVVFALALCISVLYYRLFVR